MIKYNLLNNFYKIIILFLILDKNFNEMVNVLVFKHFRMIHLLFDYFIIYRRGDVPPAWAAFSE